MNIDKEIARQRKYRYRQLKRIFYVRDKTKKHRSYTVKVKDIARHFSMLRPDLMDMNLVNKRMLFNIIMKKLYIRPSNPPTRK